MTIHPLPTPQRPRQLPVEHSDHAAMARLRRYLLDTLAAELPGRIETHQRGGPTMSADERRDLAKKILTDAVQTHSERALIANRPLLANATERQVVTQVLDELCGLSGLQPLLDDPTVETVNVNRWDQVIVQYVDGRRAQVAPIAASNDDLTDLVRTWAARASSQERRFDQGNPAVNLQLPGGARLFAVLGLTAGAVTALSIRRHGYLTVTLAELQQRGTIDAGLHAFLAAAVRARKNVLITGGTGVGKTTLLRALAAEMDPMERIVTIEDAFELALDRDPAHLDVTALQAREPNIEGEGAVSQADLVRWALRMSPDRVIVGEIRGPEVIPMCNAMSQGNDGSMATLHASSSQIAFTRLASYAAQSPERLPLEATNLLIAGAVHFVVHLDRVNGTRLVSSVREVVGADGPQVVSNEVYRPGTDRRARPVRGALRADTLDDLTAAGLDPAIAFKPDGWWTP
ncbi:Type II/IV secretion system ATP hydrolase TadA/VirB11/CpaF, TadA subfamily [Alloactinosynnema sp. L-07]|uniref:CpaF family protein n=1 Tax=Alloactinosynnema sp. L-07 TaxID=1653480 RepID=UPI00065F09E0|nr:ATPase, T2SS/T4P/T4SS family [Alloactinosynnema sp. L-07]CRK57644.1 Type II/IV secretion system ATP hydrolase TadA/VirB11/CpaF, TadA subfamily [Alloactinosynnema sp. L-07]